MEGVVQQPVKQRLRVYRPDIIKRIVKDGQTELLLAQKSSYEPSKSSSKNTTFSSVEIPGTPVKSTSERALTQRLARAAEMACREEAVHREIQRQIDEKMRKKEENFQSMYKEVVAGVEEEEGTITAFAQNTLDHRKQTDQRKQRHLYGEWKDQVYDVIQDRIQDTLQSRTTDSIELRLRTQYQKFLDATNKKLALFRDVIIEADYNPLEVRNDTLRISTKDIWDPLKRDIARRTQEQRMIGLVDDLTDQTIGKPTLTTLMWDKLESTPYGRNMDTEGNYIVTQPTESAQSLQKTHITFDHYNVPVGKDVMLQEVPKGRATVPGPDVRSGRKPLTATLQQHDGNKSLEQLRQESLLVGDLWLEAKGKAKANKEEATKMAHNFQHVISHRCNDQPQVSGGDEWLEAKGKRQVDGPEKRAGRQNLFETFQHGSNPLQDKRTLGDVWLEYKGKSTTRSYPDHDMHQYLTDRVLGDLTAPTQISKRHQSNLGNEDECLTVLKSATGKCLTI